jgi:hypothetical protein
MSLAKKTLRDLRILEDDSHLPLESAAPSNALSLCMKTSGGAAQHGPSDWRILQGADVRLGVAL